MNSLHPYSEYAETIFDFNNSSFEGMALDIFRFQYANNPIYRLYADTLQKDINSVGSIADIPFLPISFFKSQIVASTSFEPEAIFESSGTTGSVNSRHYIKDLSIYTKSFLRGFGTFYGDPQTWCILGLLPSYLERKNSSLVLMVDELIRRTGHPDSGFYLYDHNKLQQVLYGLEERGQKTLLIGVSFALLDFAEHFPMSLRNTIVMETGGMKGRREEITREELHDILKRRFNLPNIHSEYGMTELLSQAYSSGNGIFRCPAWMKIFIRDEEDPLHLKNTGINPGNGSISGVINVVDLANIYSCSFLATDDIGKLYPDGSFEVSGRIDNSDLRGCSLLVAGS